MESQSLYQSASRYAIRWELKEDDKVIQSGDLALSTAPLSRELVHIPYKKPALIPGKEYRLMLHAVLKKDELWAKAGHEVAWEELELPWSLPCSSEEKVQGIPSYSLSEKELIVSGEGFKYVFNRTDGQLTSMVVQDMELLESPLRLNLWRAPLANELDNWNASSARSSNWKEGYGYTVATEMYSAGIDRLTHQPLSFSVSETTEGVHIHIIDAELMGKGEKEKKDLYIEGVQNNGIINHYEYIINSEGTIEIRHVLKPEGKMPLWFPRIGLTLTVSDCARPSEMVRPRTARELSGPENRLSDGDICLYRTSYVRALSNATRLRIADRCTLVATDYGQRHRPSIQDERMV